MNPPPFRLFLAIRSLHKGGAERQMVELAKGVDKERFALTLCTLYGGGELERELKESGVEIFCLHKRGRSDFSFLRRYRALIQEQKPKAIYSFLPEMNLFSLIASRFLKRSPKILWGFRSSDMDVKSYGWQSRLYYAAQKLLSPFASKIITNSHHSLAYHKHIGYCMKRAQVIHNGIDTKRFSPSLELRESFRQRYPLKDKIAIGIAARMDIAKGYPYLAKAAKIILSRYPKVLFFAAGEIDPLLQKECLEILGQEGERFIWLGGVERMEEVYNGWDILVSSSLTESFSNSIAEGMACALAPIATDVGDTSAILGEVGVLIPPKDSEMLAQKLALMIESDFKTEGERARERIVTLFSLEAMIQNSTKAILTCAES